MKLKVGIICATDKELEPFLPCIKKCKTSEKAMLKFYEGVIENVEIVTLFCGVCKAHVCYVNNLPFIAIRLITDTVDHSGFGEFEKNCVEAFKISMKIVACILKEMSNSR